MLRGGVFIGVDRTGGGVAPLQAAASGAASMYDWAINPAMGAMNAAQAHLITDAKDPKDGADHKVTVVEVSRP